jgi:hypothetical protein
MRRPEKLGNAMSSALKGLNLDLRMREGKAMALWPDIVGEVTANRTKPLYVNRGALVVLVASSAWANQLNLLKPKLLQAFAERCGPGVIKDIRWKSGDQEPEAERKALEAMAMGIRRHRPPKDETPLPEAERQAIDGMLRAITDAELHKTIERTLVAQARRRMRLKRVGWITCKRCGVLHDQGDRPFLRAPRQEVLGAPAPVAPVQVPEGSPRPPIDRLEGLRLCPVCRMELNAILD